MKKYQIVGKEVTMNKGAKETALACAALVYSPNFIDTAPLVVIELGKQFLMIAIDSQHAKQPIARCTLVVEAPEMSVKEEEEQPK